METSAAAEKKTFDQAVPMMELTDEEQRIFEQVTGGDEPTADAPVPRDGEPEWKIPQGMKLPVGQQGMRVVIRGSLTVRPDKGDRECIVWNLTSADEKIALKRTRGNALTAPDELAKQMIRAIDGHKVDWTGVATGPGNADVFWDEIGGKYRTQFKNLYAKNHMMDAAESADFFMNCVDVRTFGT